MSQASRNRLMPVTIHAGTTPITLKMSQVKKKKKKKVKFKGTKITINR